jgi:hypothetical protein
MKKFQYRFWGNRIHSFSGREGHLGGQNNFFPLIPLTTP